MCEQLLSNIINIIHTLFVLFVLLVPFTEDKFMLIIHALIIPNVLLHWFLNNNVCSLTVLEKKIREKTSNKKENEEDCFTCKLIYPIYDFKKNYNEFSNLSYLVSIILFLISSNKIYHMYQNSDSESFLEFFLVP